MKIGITLSGGGVRALIFHLGVLKRLADENLLEEISQISTVSGGSLCTGLIYRINKYNWPSSNEYLVDILPKIKETLINKNLQLRLILLSLFQGKLVRPRGNLLAFALRKIWGIKGTFGDLKDKPIWWINATCYETGKNWIFGKEYIGDYKYTKTKTTNKYKLSTALAASAAFPGLIGPVVFRPKWGNRGKVHLWDGGVYDNLGTEVFYKPYKGIVKNIDMLIVSDAGSLFQSQKRCFFKSPLRLIDITTSQIRGLRSRILVSYFKRKKNSGCYFQIGNTMIDILKAARVPIPSNLEKKMLGKDSVSKIANYSTNLKKVKEIDFKRIMRHGYEVADATLHGYLGFNLLTTK